MKNRVLMMFALISSSIILADQYQDAAKKVIALKRQIITEANQNIHESNPDGLVVPYQARQDFVPIGLYQQEELNTEQKRAPLIIKGDLANRFKRYEDSTVFMNLIHDGRFWIAEAQTNNIADIILQQVIFIKVPHTSLPLAAHYQLRYKFKRPMTLYPQVDLDREGNPTQESVSPVEINGMVFSTEFNSVPGHNFNPLMGAIGALFPSRTRFTAVGRAASLDEMAYKDVKWTGNLVKQYEIYNMDDSTKEAMFHASLNTSHENQQQVPYHLLFRSCVTATFRAIDRARGRDYLIMPVLQNERFNANPFTPRTQLLARGYRTKNLPHFHEELTLAYLDNKYPHWNNRLKKENKQHEQDSEDFQNWLASQKNSPYSLCRFFIETLHNRLNTKK